MAPYFGVHTTVAVHHFCLPWPLLPDEATSHGINLPGKSAPSGKAKSLLSASKPGALCKYINIENSRLPVFADFNAMVRPNL